MGGDIPWTAISAKAGTGIDELLDLVILTADLHELTADSSLPGHGKIIESNVDTKRGNTATLLITDGTLKTGQFVIAGNAFSPVRIMEDSLGKAIKEAGPSTPVQIVGFNEIPKVGSKFVTVDNKKMAEAMVAERKLGQIKPNVIAKRPTLPVIPILIKADMYGTLEAIQHELAKFESDRIMVKVIDASVGDITANDVQNISATPDAIIVGFNVKVERQAKDLSERLNVEIDTFDIIYELSDWLNTALKNRTPKKEEKIESGSAKVLKHFSTQKNLFVLGGRMEEGVIKMNQRVRILRRDIEIGTGGIKNLQQYKSDVQQVEEGEFGMQIETKAEVAAGDYIKPYDTVIT
jgi:translation initiation factor IF-2